MRYSATNPTMHFCFHPWMLSQILHNDGAEAAGWTGLGKKDRDELNKEYLDSLD